jgi:E3 ubiquitin-protein ligase SHPRH
VEAIVRRLLLLLQLDPANKVIVFSSWLDVLDILSHALTANGIHHAFGRGRKGFLQALEQFKGCAVTAGELQDAAAASGEQLASQGRRQQQQLLQQGSKRQQEEGAEADATEQMEINLASDELEAAAEEADEDRQAGADDNAGAATARPSTAAAKAAGAAGANAAARGRPRVLLMLVTHGAAGLNLTEAQHVVLVEPLLDPAQELQATGRISRFGQTATTHVHR